MGLHPGLSALILAGFVLLPLPSIARAVTVTVAPAETSVVLGDSFTLRIVTDAFPDLKAFETIHSFDAARIQLTGADAGDVLTGSGYPYSAFLVPDDGSPADSAFYDAAVLNGSSAGPGILVFLDFKAIQKGDSPVRCQAVDFRDSNNHQTLPACVGGLVHVVGPVPAMRGSWGRIRAIYR